MTDNNESTSSDRAYKWLMLGLLAVTYFLMHGSRQVFNASLPQIKGDLAGHGVTDAQLGLSRTYFLFAYGCMVPFAGIAADFFRRKWVVVIGTLLFSTSVLFTGFADSMLMFFILYGILNGVGQCMIPGPASSLIAQYHTETRSTALSIYQSALYVGILVSSVLAGWLGGESQGGWRISFWVFGGVAVIWTFLLAAFLRNTPALQTHATGQDEKPKLSEACKAFFAKPTALLLTFAFGMLVFGSNCFRTWMPAFMQQKTEWALSPGAAAFHAVFWFYLGSFIGIAVGARTSDKFSRMKPGIRITIMAVGLALSAPTMAGMVLVPTLWLSCAMMFLFGLGGGFFDCNLYAGLFDVVAPRFRSAAMGMYLCGAFFIGCPATWLVGVVCGSHPVVENGAFEMELGQDRGIKGWECYASAGQREGSRTVTAWDAAGWTKQDGLGPGIAVDKEVHHSSEKSSGTQSLLIEPMTNGPASSVIQFTQTVGDLAPGEYTISAWVKCAQGGSRAAIKYGTQQGEEGEIRLPEMSDDWQELRAKVAIDGELQLRLYAESGAKVWIDDLKLLDAKDHEVVRQLLPLHFGIALFALTYAFAAVALFFARWRFYARDRVE